MQTGANDPLQSGEHADSVHELLCILVFNRAFHIVLDSLCKVIDHDLASLKEG